ncbi:alkyl hydroperoxide reductase subunit F [Vaginisenegalia massiliensis]|uniref:alkyl hydroperoxide reductase subunit F n=1 Tax=Vaginisenegalia massiliensis TaxID=2058294 RepID=UPI000F543B93|nr:alkyl hydroperoxide reductase subunit F [Vaginisenegalia massiliensis]
MALTQEIKQQFAQYMALLEHPIQIQLSLDESESSQAMRTFIQEIASLSDKISIEETSLPLTPSFSLNRQNESSGISFAGIPLGHEFESFVLALLQVGGRAPKISSEAKERIQAIDQELHFETFVSLTCHNCPDVVQALNIMSVLNPKISHTMIEGGTFKNLAEEKAVMAVPTVFLNDEEVASGRMTLDQLLDKVSNPIATHSFDQKPCFDVLVIGGGPAGGAAAIYAARKGLQVGLVAKDFGGQVIETLGIENIIGIPYTEGPKYMNQVKEHLNQYKVDIIENQTVTKIDSNDLITIDLESGHQLKAKTLIIATGARWRLLGIPGELEFRNKGVAYCTHCDGPLFKGKRVAVIGGGNSGVEAAIDLASMVKEVVLLEFMPQLKADQVLQDRLNSLTNVKVITNAQTTEITGDKMVNGIQYIDRVSGQALSEDIQGCFIQIGLVPNTDFVKDQLDLTKFGEIIVDEHGATNLKGVFAAGDCTNTAYKQIVISLGSGATAALGAFDYLIRQ